MRCERKPPEGWPGRLCHEKARYDVLYHIKTQELPRGIRVCTKHLLELKELDERGMLKAFEVQDL
jgi:hypothetical protein